MYTAIYTQIVWIGCWCQFLLKQLGNIFKLIKLKFHVFGNVCNSIELNDHGSAFIQSAKPSGRHKIMAQDVKHLPRLKLYRPIIVGALEVRLAVDLAVLLSNHERHPRHLLWRLCCRS